MDKSISHFRLWQIFCEDKVYGKSQFVKDICHELAENLNLQVNVLHVLQFGAGSRKLQINLLLSPEYPQALEELREYQESTELAPQAGPSITQSDGAYCLWQEIFLILAAEYGLPFRNEPKHLNPDLDLFTIEYLQVASPKIYRKHDLQDYLFKHELPLPAELFPEHKPNTMQLKRNVPEGSNWEMEYSLSNVRELLKTWEEEAQASLVIKEKIVTFSYLGKSVDIRRKNGHVFLRHMVLHPGKEFRCTELYRLVGNLYDEQQAVDTSEMGLEEGFELADMKTRQSTLTEKRKLEAKLEEAKQDEDHDRRAEIEEEVEWLEKYLKENFYASGKPKIQRTSADNNCRNNVCNAIKRCVKELNDLHFPLFEHLSKSDALKYGYTLIYKSPPGITWK